MNFKIFVMFLKQKGFRLKKTYKKTLIFLISNLTDNKVYEISTNIHDIIKYINIPSLEINKPGELSSIDILETYILNTI